MMDYPRLFLTYNSVFNMQRFIFYLNSFNGKTSSSKYLALPLSNKMQGKQMNVKLVDTPSKRTVSCMVFVITHRWGY